MGGLGQRLVERLDRFQRRHPIAAVTVGTFKKFGSDEGGRLAALVAYYGFFALFPLLLVFVTVSSWVLAGNVELQQRLLDSALAQFPIIGDQIGDNLGQVSGSGVALAIGLVGAFWGGWGALGSMRRAMETIWAAPGQTAPGFLRSQLRSLALLIALGGGVVATAAVSLGAEALRGLGWIGGLVAIAGPFIVALVLFTISFLLLAPIRLHVRDVLPGALLAATGWVALQVFGVALLRHQLRNASALYGVFGLVIGLLGWMYLQAQIAMFAAELNAVLRGRLWPVSVSKSVGHPGTQVEQRLAQDA